MNRSKPATETRSLDEVRASIRKNLSLLLGEELDEEEWLRLTEEEMEQRLMEAMLLVRARLAARLGEGPVTPAEE